MFNYKFLIKLSSFIFILTMLGTCICGATYFNWQSTNSNDLIPIYTPKINRDLERYENQIDEQYERLSESNKKYRDYMDKKVDSINKNCQENSENLDRISRSLNDDIYKTTIYSPQNCVINKLDFSHTNTVPDGNQTHKRPAKSHLIHSLDPNFGISNTVQDYAKQSNEQNLDNDSKYKDEKYVTKEELTSLLHNESHPVGNSSIQTASKREPATNLVRSAKAF